MTNAPGRPDRELRGRGGRSSRRDRNRLPSRPPSVTGGVGKRQGADPPARLGICRRAARGMSESPSSSRSSAAASCDTHAVDVSSLVEAGRHQDAIAQPIDEPRQAARRRLNLINGVCGERRPIGRADDPKAMAHIGSRVHRAHRPQPVERQLVTPPLAGGFHQQGLKPGLTRNDHLQPCLLDVTPELGKSHQVAQGVRREVLRFVDHEETRSAARAQVLQVRSGGPCAGRPASRRRRRHRTQ